MNTLDPSFDQPQQVQKNSYFFSWFKSHRQGIYNYVLFLMSPIVCFLFVEILNEANPFKNLSNFQWLLNLLWYYFILSLGWILFGKLKSSIWLTTIFSFIAGLANHYVFSFRGRALFPIDILALKTALNVAGEYDYKPDKYILFSFLIVCLLLILSHFIKESPTGNNRKIRFFVSLGLTTTWSLYIALFFFTNFLPMHHIYSQQWETQANGFFLNFTASARYMRLDKPDNYSEETAEEMIEELESLGFESDDYSSNIKETTNFIVIMDESFADLTTFEDLTLSYDPISFYHSLTENTIKGTMISPVTGGGTASVEFEVLTGNNTAFFPYGTVPYQLYVTDKTPSLASVASDIGYESSAYHPYLSSGWNRPSAYEHLGFDSQYYQDEIINGDSISTHYSDADMIRGFVSDIADFQRIFKITDDAKQEHQSCFVFNVTMQNHSGYDKSWTNLDDGSELTGKYSHHTYEKSTEQYLALAEQTDDALQQLVAHYSNEEEPTVILFFGDHQPPLSNDLYEDLYHKDLDERTEEEILKQHETPFFIWANFDIEEQDNVKIGASFLGVYASKIVGFPQTGYMKYLSEINETFTAISPVGYIMQDGRVIEDREDLSKEEQDILDSYEVLQYCNLFADNDIEYEFFFGS